MEREACVCDHGYERSDLCAEIIIIIIIALALYTYIYSRYFILFFDIDVTFSEFCTVSCRFLFVWRVRRTCFHSEWCFSTL